MSSDVTGVWPHDLVTLILVLRIERKIVWKERKQKWKGNEINLEFTAFSFDKVASTLDLQTIENYVKNANYIKSARVEVLCLS